MNSSLDRDNSLHRLKYLVGFLVTIFKLLQKESHIPQLSILVIYLLKYLSNIDSSLIVDITKPSKPSY